MPRSSPTDPDAYGQLRVTGKIALEEHVVTRELVELVSAVGVEAAAWERIIDRLCDTEQRLAEMDRVDIEVATLSFPTFGIQDIRDPVRAIALAKRANDALAGIVAGRPDRFVGLAALPMHDPGAAADELERTVTQLGFKGALVNGFSATGDSPVPLYYDTDRYLLFWERVEALDVPFYLHPRNPLAEHRISYEGRPELLGGTWAFGVETATHALRLITSGLFDRFPGLTVIVGHLGEFLPFALPRLEDRMSHYPFVSLAKPATQYLRDNFYVTTSGNRHDPSLIGVLLTLGADRILFACDHPFESMEETVKWFDGAPMSELDRRKIGRENAVSLLGL